MVLGDLNTEGYSSNKLIQHLSKVGHVAHDGFNGTLGASNMSIPQIIKVEDDEDQVILDKQMPLDLFPSDPSKLCDIASSDEENDQLKSNHGDDKKLSFFKENTSSKTKL